MRSAALALFFLPVLWSFTPLFSSSKRGKSRTLQLSSSSSTADSSTTTPPPVLNGKRVLPYKIILSGLKGHRIPAVFCVLNSSYQRSTDGWDAATYIGVTQDLATTLISLHDNDPTELRVAHVRALSFATPQPNAMQDVADDWRQLAKSAGAKLEDAWAGDVLNYVFDDEEEDDDEDSMEMMADAMAAMQSSTPIVSPFASSVNQEEPTKKATTDLPFTRESVDSALDEVRPYLIADGGNVAIERVDADEKLVVLKLEGACGSCASSTVTMQMGIERVLKEKWADVTIAQADDNSGPKELEWQAVETEVNRLRPALMAMGSTVELKSVDAETGTVVIKFIGSSKVRQGLELAIADVDFVNEVTFVDED